MGRGKIEIKKIENPTNRQVTYSKRRSGIMKKAKELTVLCDAQVSIIMMSSSNKIHEYCSPNTNTKSIYDRYQSTAAIDLWNAQYERMQKQLNHLKEINMNLRREMRQRTTGEDLDGLDFNELRGLEQNLGGALKEVRERKYHLISTQTQTHQKKWKSTKETHNSLLHQLKMKNEHPVYGFVDDDPTNYEGAIGLANGASHMYAFRLQPNQPNLHAGTAGYGHHDLRLA